MWCHHSNAERTDRVSAGEVGVSRFGHSSTLTLLAVFFVLGCPSFAEAEEVFENEYARISEKQLLLKVSERKVTRERGRTFKDPLGGQERDVLMKELKLKNFLIRP